MAMPLMLEDVWQCWRRYGNSFNVGGRVAMPLMLEDVWQCL